MSEPRVFLEVMRPMESGPPLVVRVEVSLMLLEQTKHPCALLTDAFNQALAQAGYRPSTAGLTIP